jgi:GNAT superfamily N-acetyltransferase
VIESRAAREADFDAVAEVWFEAGRTADGAPADHPSLGELRARVDREVAADWRLTVAVEDGRIIAFLAIKPAQAILDQLFVLPSRQRLGAGSLLLACAMRDMPDGFTLRTATANTRARRFYERSGLTLVSESLHPRYGTPVCIYGWNVA